MVDETEKDCHEMGSQVFAIKDRADTQRLSNIVEEVFEVHKVFTKVCFSLMSLIGKTLMICLLKFQYSKCRI